MDVIVILVMIYAVISVLTAILYGAKRQVGFAWTLFLMAGGVLGWIILVDDDLKCTDPPPATSEGKISGGIVMIGGSLLIAYLMLKDTGIEDFGPYFFLILILGWVLGAGYYLMKRGAGTVFNQGPKPEPKPKSEFEQEQFQKDLIEIPSSSLLIIDYDADLLLDRVTTGSYPVLRVPKKGSVIRSHRNGGSRRRGYKEESFQQSIEKYLGDLFDVSGSVQIFTGGRPYEPDIALIDKRKSGSLRIDIEIDEPYAGLTRLPIHCSDEDESRDRYFMDRGWIVIRFSEYQVHHYERSCLKYVADVVATIDTRYSVNVNLVNLPDLDVQPFWDVMQAQKWECEKYRENYLNHEFGVMPEGDDVEIGDLSLQEILEEKHVISSFVGTAEKFEPSAFNAQHGHNRDARIVFYPEKHDYTIDGIPAISVSSVIDRFFPQFDAIYFANKKAASYGISPHELLQKWRQDGEDAMRRGTQMHQEIEQYFLEGVLGDSGEMTLFQKFIHDHPWLTPYRTEWRIFDERYRLAGTIDMLVKNAGGFEIYDWKRSKKVVDANTGEPITGNIFQSGLGALSNIPDTSFNRYCLQQGLYRYMLEKNYGINVSEMFVVVLHSIYDRYYKIKLPYLRKEVGYMLSSM